MYKIKILLPVLMILSVTGLTMLPSMSEATNNESTFVLSNPIEEILVLNQKVNIKFDDMGIMKASWYGPRFHGRLTANGEIYDQMGYTAAHKSLPFGTLLRLTNPKNNKSIVVRINDRGPYIPGRKIDLSKKAAMELGGYNNGVVQLKVEKITISGLESSFVN